MSFHPQGLPPSAAGMRLLEAMMSDVDLHVPMWSPLHLHDCATLPEPRVRCGQRQGTVSRGPCSGAALTSGAVVASRADLNFVRRETNEGVDKRKAAAN